MLANSKYVSVVGALTLALFGDGNEAEVGKGRELAHQGFGHIQVSCVLRPLILRVNRRRLSEVR